MILVIILLKKLRKAAAFGLFVGIAAATNAQKKVGDTKNAMKMYSIKGTATMISIAASSYDALDSKKPLCQSVTNSCVAVKDQVWDTFLREVAPQIKTAELLAESNLRTSCISNISNCFQKACKDTIDPNDPDGSYDMCLTRPDTLRSLCKVEIDPCEEAEPAIMDFVRARLASMRVDACTNDVKHCLTTDDRCGKDYTNCVGLDTDTIVRMCPADKLVGCQKQYGEEYINSENVYDALEQLVQGIFLNIDNNLLAKCQAAADQAMITVCGDTDNCNSIAVDTGVGSRSLKYKIIAKNPETNTKTSYDSAAQIPESILRNGGFENLSTEIIGQIAWENLEFDNDGQITVASIKKATDDADADSQSQIKSEISIVQKSITNAINTIESDTTVEFCKTGRNVQGVQNTNGRDAGRFKNLTQQMRYIIAIGAITAAKENYMKQYDKVQQDLADEVVKVSERIAQIKNEDALELRREFARQACVNYAQGSTLGNSEKNVGQTNLDASKWSSGTIGSIDMLIGASNLNERTYKEVTTSTFNSETLVCHRCIRSQTCAKTKGKNCREWNEPTNTCVDIQM